MSQRQQSKLNQDKRFPCAYVVVRFHTAQRECKHKRMQKERNNALLGLVLALLLMVA